MHALIVYLGGANQVGRWMLVGVLVAARVMPLTVLAPWLALRETPAVVRAGIIVALTAALAPLAFASAPASVGAASVAPLPWLVAREALVGTVFALAASLPLYALDWAGQLVDIWRGASLAQVLGPLTGERSTPLGALYLLLGISVFTVLGGHRLAIAAFASGLRVAPVGVATVGVGWSAAAFGAARLSAGALAFALAVAAPAGVTLIVVEAALGLVARAAPQVPVYFAGMPLRAAVAIAALLLGLSFGVGQLPTAIRDAVDAALSFVRALG